MRSEEIDDFLGAHMLSVIRGLGVRTGTLDQFLSPYAIYAVERFLHVHQLVMAGV